MVKKLFSENNIDLKFQVDYLKLKFINHYKPTYFSNNFEIHLLSTNLHLYQNLPQQGLEKLRCMIFGTHLLTVQGTFTLKDRVACVSLKNIQITCFRVFHG